MTLSQFLSMSGYGAYVWPCYALTFAVMIGMAVQARQALRAEVLRAQRRAQVAGAEEKS